VRLRLTMMRDRKDGREVEERGEGGTKGNRERERKSGRGGDKEGVGVRV
jgi:hypothetical protein